MDLEASSGTRDRGSDSFVQDHPPPVVASSSFGFYVPSGIGSRLCCIGPSQTICNDVDWLWLVGTSIIGEQIAIIAGTQTQIVISLLLLLLHMPLHIQECIIISQSMPIHLCHHRLLLVSLTCILMSPQPFSSARGV